MTTNQNWLKLIAVTFAIAPLAAANADDLLGGKRGGGSGKSGGSGSGSGGGGTRGGGNSGGGSQKKEDPPKKSDDRGRDGGSRSTGGGSSSSGGSGGSGTSSSGGGRVVQDRGSDAQLTNRRSQGRSGSSQYGTNSNGSTRSSGARIVVDDNVPNYSDARRQANREENVRVVNGGNRHQYRSGYYHYDQNWCDDNFTYPYYSFTYSNNSALSPWYSYSHLPAYVSYRRVSFDDCFELRIGLDFNYRWEARRSYDRYSDTYELDRAVSNIDQAFDQDDVRRLGNLIPSRGRVTIRTRWERPYTLNSDDYYDMMEDLIENTRTRNYHIRNVEHDRNWDTVRVTAEHIYQDSWRKTRSNWHTYTLEDTGRGYRIVEFSVNDRN